MDKQTKLSIIIVNYKVIKQTLSCIESIRKSTKNVSCEIIAVDNEENSSLKREVKELRNVKYLNPNKNLGYGAGINYGAKHAKGKYLLILNPDTTVQEGAIDSLYHLIKTKAKVGVVAPLLLDKKNKPYGLQGVRLLTPLRAFFSLTFIAKLFKNNKIRSEYYIQDWSKKEDKEVDVVPGTAFMIKKSLFEKIGGFDEKFFLYFEEFDLCKRLKDSGYKNYINVSAQIVHEWGLSTKQREDRDKIFDKSRFYYFRKHFGLTQAVIINCFSKIGRNSFILFFASLLAIYFSLYEIGKSMLFIGDQAWFYLSARDMIVTKSIPLVGITSSHTWLHQGPLWTYLLAPFLLMFNFNPISGAYLSAIINVLTIWAVYILTKMLFDKNTAVITAVLYATSPLILILSRMPYHTTPIPLFTTLFIYSTYKWLLGHKLHFSLSLLYLGILYNLELATVTLFSIPIALAIYGFIKNSLWFKNIYNKKTLFSALALFLIPMIPIIIYDFSNGFQQTLKFILWIGYKIVGIFHPLGKTNSASAAINDLIAFLANNYQQLVFPVFGSVALLILLAALINLAFILKKQDNRAAGLLILIWIVIGWIGIIASKTTSDAYLPLLFPALILATGLLFKKIIFTKIWPITLVIFILFISININYILNSKQYLSNDLLKREKVVNKIMKDTKGKKFLIKGRGEGSQFRSFLMPYEYLFWYSYKIIPNEQSQDIYYIEEASGKIIVSK